MTHAFTHMLISDTFTFQIYSPMSFFGPRFCFHYDCCLEGKFPLRNLQIFSSLFWKNFDTLFFLVSMLCDDVMQDMQQETLPVLLLK